MYKTTTLDSLGLMTQVSCEQAVSWAMLRGDLRKLHYNK